MNPLNQQGIFGPPTATTDNRHFVITLTNFPNLLLRTQHYQQLPTNPIVLRYQNHEQFLYNELRINLQENVQAYLQRTELPYPINYVFDYSNNQPR